MTRPSDLTPAPSPDGSRPAGSMAAGARDWLEAWDRIAGMPTIVLRNELEAEMARLGAAARVRSNIGWDGRPYRGTPARRAAPHLNPTKGYRGAHKLFRGGSR